MKICKKHKKQPVVIYSHCIGCEIESYINATVNLSARIVALEEQVAALTKPKKKKLTKRQPIKICKQLKLTQSISLMFINTIVMYMAKQRSVLQVL